MSKILKISSETCVPCQRMKEIEKVVLPLFPAVDFEVINISTEEGMEKARSIGIRSVPTYIFTKTNGITISIQTGEMKEDKFKDLLELVSEEG